MARPTGLKTKFNPEQRQLIIRDFIAEAPKTLSQIDAWVAKTAAAFDLAPAVIRRIIALEAHSFDQSLRLAHETAAQQAANLFDATLVTAIATLRRNMRAKKSKIFMYKGTPVLDPTTGKVFMHVEEDGKTQVRAAELLLELHAAMAPKKVEVTHDVSDRLAELTDEQIMAKHRELTIEVAKLLQADGVSLNDIARAYRDGADPDAADAAAGRTPGPQGRGGRFLLADQSDEDEG